MRRPLRVMLAAVAAVSVPAQSTWIVDDTPGPGVDFTSLPTAVAAAASGDTLLVMPGSYRPFQVSGKALSIFGDGSATTFVELPSTYPGQDYVVIQSTPPGTTFRVSGLRVRHDLPTPSSYRLAIVDGGATTAGTVTLSDVISGPATTASALGAGLFVFGARVHAYRCDFTGSSGPLLGIYAGDAGATVVNSALFVADACELRGSSLTLTSPAYSAVGGAGLLVDDSTCRISRSQLVGGHVQAVTQLGSTGGPGLDVMGNSVVQLLGGTSHAVTGGNALLGPMAYGGSGVRNAAPATVTTFGPIPMLGGTGVTGDGATISGPLVTTGLPTRPALTMTGTAPAGGDLLATQPVTIAIDDGPPNQLFALLIDVEPGFTTLPGLTSEPLLVSVGAYITSFGLLDAAGGHSTTFVPTTSTPLWVGLPLHLQAFVFAPGVGLWLGSNGEQRRCRL